MTEFECNEMDRQKDLNEQNKKDLQPSALHEEALFGPRVIGDRSDICELTDTETPAPEGTKIGPSNPNAEIVITMMIKSKASDEEIDRTIKEIAEGKRQPVGEAEFNERFGADPESMKRVCKFIMDNGLKLEKADPTSGQIQILGSIDNLCDAFGVKLDDYKDKDGANVNREREGRISIPKSIAADVESILGLEDRIQAEPHFQRPTVLTPKTASPSFLSNEVADLYNFPKASMGEGQSVGIIELGGGIDLKDNAEYYKNHNLKEPPMQVVTINGAKNALGQDADGEVALDCQIIGGVAPDANQQLIFAPNNDQGFVDAVTRATFPETGEKQNSVISISWGAPESFWSEQAMESMNAAFKKAALKGISVFAASGDTGALNSSPDGRFTADYPSSDPFVTGTGGTKLSRDGTEIVWNEKGGATGGGISEKWPIPDFQKGVQLPPNANADGKPGRGDPDIAGNAAPGTGYRIRVGGQDTVVGGTSAVAPLYAGLMLRINGELGRPIGYLNPILYKHADKGIFKDITEGNNNGYAAGPGWDATTGWGSLKGQEFLNQLKTILA